MAHARPNIVVKGNELIITVDISAEALKKAEPSKSGKSHVVSTTSGLVGVSGAPVRVNLTVTD